MLFFDMEVSEDIKAAKDVIQAFLKAKKTVRMYPENNPIYRKTLDDTFSRLSDLFSYRDEFNLKIKQNEIFFEAEQIYANTEKDDNLALFFFKDGLRELTFTRGLSLPEMEEFLKIISLDFDREAVDDDIVTLLWEKDFRNIKYVADDAFLVEDEDFERAEINQVKGKASGPDEILKAYAAAFESEDVKGISIVNLTDKDLQVLVKEMEKDTQDKTGKIYQILLEMLLQAESAPEYEDVLGLLRNVFSYSLKQRDLRTAVDIMQQTKTIAESLAFSDTVKRQMNLLLASVNSEESVKSLGEIFDSDAALDEQVVSEYMGFLNRISIPSFISLLGELESIHGRKIVITILIHLGKHDIQAVAKGLQDNRWFVVRNIIYVLRHIGDKKAVEYLLATAKHADERVKKEAIKTLGDLKNPLALQTLRDCLDDAEPSIRKIAVKALGSIGSETAKRIILERLSEKEFRGKDFDEKRDFYEILARWNHADVVDFLIGTLKKRALFGKAKVDENRACAAYCLGLMGNKDSLPVLSRLRESKNKLLRESVNTAIRKIEHV
ncbi:MAG TPA: HEAT repeat domain-containing protein [Thermodesulfovibrionales bacterium]|nr:HEAT repeat domain-containing protein [Thermodesulfovibrionales bacterium]